MAFILFWIFFISGMILRNTAEGMIYLIVSALFRIAAEIHRLGNPTDGED